MDRATVTASLLVPLDGSPLADRAIPWAQAIAGPDTRIVLLRVLPPPGAVEELLGRRGADATGAAETAARAALESSAAALAGRAGVELAVATGDPAEVIVAEAESRGIGAIVIASHARGAIGRWMFGSVADRVARTSTVPVVILREDEEADPGATELRRVVVPLDGSPRALEALPAAREIAAAHSLPIHLLTAIDVAQLTPVAAPGVVMPVSGELYEQVFDDLTTSAQQGLDEAAATLRRAGLEVTTEVRMGPPYVAISDVLRASDLAVLTSHGRSGVRRWLLGSVAEQLVRYSPAPVMLVPSAERAGAAGAA